MVERMKEHYHINWFEEDGADYPVRVIIYKDIVTIGLDTSGESLHKRGYRRMVSKAPIEETLAAALIKLTPWNKSRILVDPFCGSGTFPIEAAMMGANIAPGMHREFQAQNWDNIVSPKLFARGFEEAESLVDTSVEMDIQGYDIDPQIVKAARENAKRAGGRTHSFPAASGSSFKPSKEVRLCNHEPSLRRAFRGKRRFTSTLP